MAKQDAKKRGTPRKTSGTSSKASSELQQDASDATPLLEKVELEVKSKAARTRRKAKEVAAKPGLSFCGILGAVVVGLIAILGSACYWLWNHEAEYGRSPPWYPAPLGGTHESWKASYEKARAMVDSMTLLEKVNITTGVGWRSGLCVGNTAPAIEAGFPSLCLQDGPLGIRFADGVSVFPAGLTVGASFNKDLMYQRGKALGEEARQKGINVLLGPSMGPIGRMPAGGRNWEGFGADPVLQGIAAAETIRGIQEEGVMATAKHFVGNEQEHFRQPFEWGLAHSMSSNIDDRTLHELYAWPFADSIRAGVATIMCSYNMVNNSQACGNSKLMNGILKDELGFQGFIHSDWLAQRSGVASALAGLDMTMPGDGLIFNQGNALWGSKLTMAALNGSLPVERLNDMAARVIAAWYQLGQDDEKKFPVREPNFSSWTKKKVGRIHHSSGENVTAEVNKFVNVQGASTWFHGRLVKHIAIDGTVLLKNEDGVLPFTREGWPEGSNAASEGRKFRVGVYGSDAGPPRRPLNSCPDRACNDGTLGQGWGSGTAEYPYLSSPIEELKKSFLDTEVEVSDYLTNAPNIAKDPSITRDKDLCLIFVTANSGEGYKAVNGLNGDRNDLHLQYGGDKLVQNVARTCGGGKGRSVVVVHSVGPVIVEPWIEIPGVKGLVFAHLPGQEAGHAITAVLFGWFDAGGRLPYTVGKSLADYGPGAEVMYYPNGVVPQQDFDEGLFIDYRHFDRAQIAPRYEFGYGLSYANFSFTDVQVETLKAKTALPSARPAGLTAPSYSSALPEPSDAVFPADFHKVPKRVYPYLDSAADVKRGAYPLPDGYSTEPHAPSPAGGAPGGNPSLWEEHVRVSVTVRNVGHRRGKAVAQLYVGFPAGVTDAAGHAVEFPEKVLRNFAKAEIRAGEHATLTMALTRRDLSYWDVVRQNWVMPTGTFTLMVGESSRRIVFEEKW